MGDAFRVCEVINHDDEHADHAQHSLKLRCASVTALELMEVKKLKRARSMLLLCAESSDDDGDESSEDDEIVLAAAMHFKVKKILGVRRIRLRKILPKVLTVS